MLQPKEVMIDDIMKEKDMGKSGEESILDASDENILILRYVADFFFHSPSLVLLLIVLLPSYCSNTLPLCVCFSAATGSL